MELFPISSSVLINQNSQSDSNNNNVTANDDDFFCKALKITFLVLGFLAAFITIMLLEFQLAMMLSVGFIGLPVIVFAGGINRRHMRHFSTFIPIFTNSYSSSPTSHSYSNVGSQYYRARDTTYPGDNVPFGSSRTYSASPLPRRGREADTTPSGSGVSFGSGFGGFSSNSYSTSIPTHVPPPYTSTPSTSSAAFHPPQSYPTGTQVPFGTRREREIT